MKSARLDQILIRLGYVGDDDVSKALERQKAAGGRLGSHLLHLGFVTEHELSRALSAQFELPCFVPEHHGIDRDIVRELPRGSARELEALAFRFDRTKGTLYLAVADPSDAQTLEFIRQRFDASSVELFVCPEVVLDRLISESYETDIDDVQPQPLPLSQETIREVDAVVSQLQEHTDPETGDPVGYARMIRSLFRAVELIAGMRGAGRDWVPPYMTIAQDVRTLAERFELTPLAADGAQLAAHLMVPGPRAIGLTAGFGDPAFSDLGDSIDIARTIHFPWRLDDIVQRVHGLFNREPVPEESAADGAAEFAAQMIAVVWFRHVTLHGIQGPEEEVEAFIKSRLRESAGVLAAPEIVDAYIRRIEASDAPAAGGVYPQVLVLSKSHNLPRQFAIRFARAGCRMVWSKELVDATQLCDRHAPTAVMLVSDGFTAEMDDFRALLKRMPETMFYAIVPDGNPAVTMELQEDGLDEVLVPPHDIDVIAARISRAIRARSERSADEPHGASRQHEPQDVLYD